MHRIYDATLRKSILGVLEKEEGETTCLRTVKMISPDRMSLVALKRARHSSSLHTLQWSEHFHFLCF